jgi:hypothetical protein
LFLLNSSGIQKGLFASRWLRWLVRIYSNHHRELIQTLYLTILSRNPTAAELAAVEKCLTGKKAKGHEAWVDLSWALINSKEFLYRH